MSAKWTVQIMRIFGQLRLILMDMGHRLMTYSMQVISKMIFDNLLLKKVNDYSIDGLLGGNGFYPPSEIIYSTKNPS
jgi:hypothetical protein